MNWFESLTPSRPEASVSSAPTRRSFLGAAALAGTAATMLGAASLELFTPLPLQAQSTLTPDEALKELMDGNERFASGRMTSFEQDLKILKDHTIDKQEPFAAVLGCADSRVPVELIFDQTIGHIFVTRVAGNIVTPEILGSLEYGAVVLGTKVILVLGHASCGAVKATIQGKDVPGQISSLFPHIQPAVDRAGPNLEAATKVNAQIQARLIAEASPALAALIKAGKLKVVAGFYDLETGRVNLIPN